MMKFSKPILPSKTNEKAEGEDDDDDDEEEEDHQEAPFDFR